MKLVESINQSRVIQCWVLTDCCGLTWLYVYLRLTIGLYSGTRCWKDGDDLEKPKMLRKRFDKVMKSFLVYSYLVQFFLLCVSEVVKIFVMHILYDIM